MWPRLKPRPLRVGAPATKVQARVRIVDAKTGQLRDIFAVDAAPFEHPGKWAIPIARQISMDKLRPKRTASISHDRQPET